MEAGVPRPKMARHDVLLAVARPVASVDVIVAVHLDEVAEVVPERIAEEHIVDIRQDHGDVARLLRCACVFVCERSFRIELSLRGEGSRKTA